MDNVSLGLVSLGVGLVNLILAIVTLGAITYFWLKHYRAGLNRAWWVLAIGFAAFAIAQTLEYRRLLTSPGQLSVSSLEITARTVFVCIVSLGLWRLFDESLKTKQRSLDTAETTIQVMRLQADTTRQGNERDLLLRISHLLNSKSSLPPILEEVCRSVREMMKAHSVWIRLRQPLSGGFQLAADPPPGNPAPAMISPRIEGVFGEVMRTGKPVVKEIGALALPGDPQFHLVVLAGFPLLCGPEVIGVLTLGYETR
ncbi:MAG TPA: GAF domain-containing protein, partial [Anaerolineales bacterium]|nr:GAF domain-containing protein [Anaerolineales bacterium]